MGCWVVGGSGVWRHCAQLHFFLSCWEDAGTLLHQKKKEVLKFYLFYVGSAWLQAPVWLWREGLKKGQSNLGDTGSDLKAGWEQKEWWAGCGAHFKGGGLQLILLGGRWCKAGLRGSRRGCQQLSFLVFSSARGWPHGEALLGAGLLPYLGGLMALTKTGATTETYWFAFTLWRNLCDWLLDERWIKEDLISADLMYVNKGSWQPSGCDLLHISSWVC